MRIVAGKARQFSIASDEALRLAKAIGSAGDIEFIVVAVTRLMIEREDKVAQRLSGYVREGVAIEQPD
jgi:hypothetical protein